jgi:outer membrane protein insertion porin family
MGLAKKGLQYPLFFICIFLFTSLSLAAQNSEPWYFGKPIENIRFEGLNHVKMADLRGISEPFIGTELSENTLLDLQSKLYALNFFKRFSAEAEEGSRGKSSVNLIFIVDERPIVESIIIRGNSRIRDGAILDEIQLKRDDIVTDTQIKADEEAIRSLYREKGYPDVAVTSSKDEQDDTNTSILTFTVDEGSQVRIGEIRFSGNAYASESTLNRKIDSKEQSLFSSGVLKEATIQNDKTKIEQYYQEEGYIDVQVVEIGRELLSSEDGRKNISLTFYIEEGKQWKFGGVAFEGNELFTDEDLSSYIRLQKGDILNLPKLQADLSRVSDLYYNDGYIFNDIIPNEQRDEQETTVSYTIGITEKGRAHIEDIIIKGNDKTKTFVIQREILLETGDVFSKDKVLRSMQNLYNTGLFSAVSPETPYGSAEGLMDLVFNVEEGRTTDIQFGVTFTGGVGDYPVIGFLKWTDHNFRGLGQEFSIGSEISGNKQSLDFSFSDDWLFGRRFSAGVNFSFAHLLHSGIMQDVEGPTFTEGQYNDGQAAPDPYSSYDEWQDAIAAGETIPSDYLMDYDEWNLSLGLNGGYTFHTPLGRLGIGTGVSSTLSYVDYDQDKYAPYNPAIRNNLEEWQFNNRFWTNLSWDRRDYIYSPTKGWYLNQTFTYTGGLLFGESHYLKSQSKGQLYFTLLDIPTSPSWSFKSILAMQSSISFILPQWYYDKDSGSWTSGVSAADSQKLYTDGMTIARGWPIDRGNEALWDNWIELRFPINEQVLWSDLYISSTGVWDTLEGFNGMGIEDFKFSMGGGIRLIIPGLPLGLYLVKTFNFNQDGSVSWDEGPIFADTLGLKLTLSLTTGLF